jgi:hypothetical protein
MNPTDYEFRFLIQQTFEAAQKIAPIIVDLIGIPESIVDLGGGAGGWLKAFKDTGTEKVYCIDHPSIKPEELLISQEDFIPYDLSKEMPSPIKCDLAISTEFAEHIDKSKSKDVVNFLTQSSSIVLFSAAIPGQVGIGHINEQRPDFWKRLYEERGYERIDVIRPKIIFDKTIPVWFRQNLYLYVDKNIIDRTMLSSVNLFIPDDFELVHTEIFEKLKTRKLSDVIREIVPSASRALKYRMMFLKKLIP